MNEEVEYDCTVRLKKLRQQAADRKRTAKKLKNKRYYAKRAKTTTKKSSASSSTGRSMSSVSGCSSESNRMNVTVNVDDDIPPLVQKHREESCDMFEKVVVEDVL